MAIQDGTFTPPKSTTSLGDNWIPIGEPTPVTNNGGAPGPSRMGGAAVALPDEVQELMARALDGLAAHQRAQGGDPNEVRLEFGSQFGGLPTHGPFGHPFVYAGQHPKVGGPADAEILAALEGAENGLHILSRAEVEQREREREREQSPPPTSPASPKPLIRPPRQRDGLTPPPKDWVAPPPASRGSGTAGGDRRPP